MPEREDTAPPIACAPPITSAPPLASARPGATARLMAETGLDEAMLRTLVHRFYDRVRADPLLGPVFAARIGDWEPHLERMVAFWSSVTLMTGRYHGKPVPAHATLPVTSAHFERWLALFRKTASEVCPPEGAAHVVAAAERIARSLHTAVRHAQAGSGGHGAGTAAIRRPAGSPPPPGGALRSPSALHGGAGGLIGDPGPHGRLEDEASFPRFEGP